MPVLTKRWLKPNAGLYQTLVWYKGRIKRWLIPNAYLNIRWFEVMLSQTKSWLIPNAGWYQTLADTKRWLIPNTGSKVYLKNKSKVYLIKRWLITNAVLNPAQTDVTPTQFSKFYELCVGSIQNIIFSSP